MLFRSEALSCATAFLQGCQRIFADKLTATLLREVSAELKNLSPGPLESPNPDPPASSSRLASELAQGPTLSYA